MGKSLTTEEFINAAKKIHGDKYDYSHVSYINSSTKVCIICPKHGEFWQNPYHHLNGEGCPKCNYSKLEEKIEKILKEEKIDFIPQKKFNWLGRQSLDFYIPKYNVGIECQGSQHFLKKHFTESLDILQKRDSMKKELCEKKWSKFTLFFKFRNQISV
jgi:hypothetical protein